MALSIGSTPPMLESAAPDRATLDPIEIASRDEITTVQLERLRFTLRHAYEDVDFDDPPARADGQSMRSLTPISDTRAGRRRRR
jgi:phenylacetate-CoA ligase